MTYVVLSGDNLTTIAKRHGLASWQAIYYANVNADFRRRRPDPNLIRPGDRITIPPNALQLAQRRLTSLRQLRNQTSESFRKQEQQLRSEFRQTQSMARFVDGASTVASILVNLGGLVAQGYQAMGKTGAALAKANRELVKTHFKNNADVGAQLTGSTLEVTGEEGLAWAVGKVLLKSWSDMWSPSYWAGRWVGQTPESAYAQAQQHLRTTSAKVIESIDTRIRTSQQEIEQLKRESSH